MGGIAYAARVVIEKIRSDNFGIVKRRVRKRALAVAISQRPDTRDLGAQLIVDLDVSAFVHGHAGLFQAEVIGIGAPSYRKQDMSPFNIRSAGGALHVRNDFVTSLGKADALRVQSDADVFALDNLLDSRRYVLVFMLNQSLSHLNDSYFTAKTAVHLPKFQTDVAASHNNQVLGKEIDVHHGTVVKIFDLFQSLHLRGGRASTDVNKNSFSREPLRAYSQDSRRLEAGVALIDCAVCHLLQPALEPSPRIP